MGNPFVTGHVDGHETMAMAVEDRLDMVKRFDLQQCREALQVEHLQGTVTKAVERRIRQLEKGQRS